MKCAECGGEMAISTSPLTETLKGEEYTVYGISRYECPSCGEYEIDAVEERRLSNELWRMYRQRHGTLSPQEISTLRKTLGLNQAEFGRLVAANVQTVSRWENGKVVPDPRASKLMALLRDVPAARAELCEMAEIRMQVSAVSAMGTAVPGVPFATGSENSNVSVANSKTAHTTANGVTVGLGKKAIAR